MNCKVSFGTEGQRGKVVYQMRLKRGEESLLQILGWKVSFHSMHENVGNRIGKSLFTVLSYVSLITTMDYHILKPIYSCSLVFALCSLLFAHGKLTHLLKDTTFSRDYGVK